MFLMDMQYHKVTGADPEFLERGGRVLASWLHGVSATAQIYNISNYITAELLEA